MTNEKISQLPIVTSPSAGDYIPVLSGGQTQRVPFANIPGTPGPFLNFRGQYLPKWRTALAKMRDGQADAKVLFVGDSTTQGAGGTHNANNPNIDSFPYRLSALLNGSGTPSQPGMIVASTGTARTSMGAGWSATSFGFGGMNCAFTATNPSGNLVITPGNGYTYDKFTISCLVFGGGGSLTATATGGTPVVQSCSGSDSIVTFTATAASAATTNAITISATGTVWVTWVEPYLSTSTHIRIANAGAGGTLATGWANDDPTFGSLPSIKAYAPDLTFINLGINDAGASESVATYIAAIQTIVTAAQVSGDVILMTMAPSSGSPHTTFEPQYVAAIQSLAQSQNLPLVDIYNRFGATYQSGLMFDNLHCTNLGYWDIGEACFAAMGMI